MKTYQEGLDESLIPFTLQINTFIAQQFLFQRQWQKVRNYARTRGIKIMGDMPIYVGYHSADVWANKNHFLLVSYSGEFISL